MDESRRPPSPLLVERFLSDTLRDSERSVFMRATSERERAQLRAEHAALQASLVERRPPAEFARVVRARAEGARREKSVAPVARALALACVLVGVAFIAREALERHERQLAASTSAGEERERAKGLAPSLRVYRRRGRGPELLAEGARVEVGDVLQLGFIAPGMSYAVLVSIDGRGHVTLHYPGSKEASTRLPAASGEQLLPEAYELDDAPEFERFVLITARRPLHATEVARAAGELSRARARDAPLSLPAYAEQVSVLLSKGGP